MVGKSGTVNRGATDQVDNNSDGQRDGKEQVAEVVHAGGSLSQDMKVSAKAKVPASLSAQDGQKRKWVEPTIALLKGRPISTETKKREDELKPRTKRVSRKDQITALYLSGMNEIEDLALITGARPSYVGSVLQEAGLVRDYFDLYTSTSHPMNVYSKFFANRLGFKDEATAHESVALIDQLYHQFEFAQDRAGQHHALSMALVMFDRARWTGKGREADIFRHWLLARLDEAELTEDGDGDQRDEEDLGD